MYALNFPKPRHGLRNAPENNEITNKTRNRKKINLAIEAAPAASPPKPNIAATIAIIKNMIVQRNIIVLLSLTYLIQEKSYAIAIAKVPATNNK